MTARRILGLLILASTLSACDEKSCGGGGGAAAAASGGSFNASKLSAPEPAKLGKPSCKSGMCPLEAPAAASAAGADRFVGPAPSESGPLTSLEGGAARLARQFDGAGAAPDPVAAPSKSSRSGWVCDGNTCRRVP